jgi:peptidoglycan/LPS O-acetylase OafA/YrhL
MAAVDKSGLPFAGILKLTYQFGGLAVETFWMISGVIFFHFYLNVIQERKMSFKHFMGLRFSRLYPLHLVTLISVAFLQLLYFKKFDTTFVYINNDFLHFVLNFFMIDFWNAKFGLSFNGPFWSVSVEIFVYMIFFLLTFTGIFKQERNFLLVTILFFCFYALGIMSPFYDCMFYFFAGCLIAQFFNKIHFGWLTLILGIAFLFLIAKYQFPRVRNNFYLIRIIDLVIKAGVFTFIIGIFGRIFSRVDSKGKKFFREVGNMTYSVYMIHVSICIILVLFFYQRGITFFNSNLFLVLYIAGTCLMGFLVYRFFELPVQNWIRNKIKNN